MRGTLGWYGSLQRRPPVERHLRAENKSARTVETYLEAVLQLDAFLTGHGVDLAGAGRPDLEAFLAGLLARWKPATGRQGCPSRPPRC